MMYNGKIREADLLFYIKVLKDKVEAFETGEQYRRMQEVHRKDLADKDRELREAKKESAQSRAETVSVREKWFQTCEDVVAEKEKALAKKEREMKKMEERMYQALRERDEMAEELHAKNTELYDVKAQLEEALGMIRELTAKLNRDYTNSSKSSSMSPNHKKIQNSREKTGRKPGGQPGHEHHGRKRLEPTQVIEIPAPAEFTCGKGYYPTGECVRRQKILLHVTPEVIEYQTPEYYCTATGKTVHADFPEGLKDDVNYDGTVKALVYLLNNECNVSIDKSRGLLEEISGGKISLSKGMVSNLSREFSEKTKDERDEVYLKLFSAPVMNTDFTFGRVSGKQGTVIVCAADGLVLYQAKEKKGHEGVKGSPVEFYEGTIVSDHEAAFHDYGTKHQECLAHVERYVRSSIENEPGLEWNKQMLEWIRKAIHCRNEAARNGDTAIDAGQVASLEGEYNEIMEKAKSEYEDDPPNEYFRDGYNLYKRMSEDRQDYMLFLHDLAVPPTNNRAENAARKCKRKYASVMCFRSKEWEAYYCDGLTIIEMMKASGENLFEGMARRFNQTYGTG